MDFIHGIAGVGGRGPAVEGFVPLGWRVRLEGGGWEVRRFEKLDVIYFHPCCASFSFSFPCLSPLLAVSSLRPLHTYVRMESRVWRPGEGRGISGGARALQTFLTLRRYKYLQARCEHFRGTSLSRPTCETAPYTTSFVRGVFGFFRLPSSRPFLPLASPFLFLGDSCALCLLLLGTSFGYDDYVTVV